MTWQKVEPYEGPIHQGCLNCPAVETVASLDMIVAVGFGDAHISKDDELVYAENQSEDSDEDFRRLGEFEEMAKEDPDHDWRMVLFGPLRGRVYQRHGEGKWVLIDSNMGFA